MKFKILTILFLFPFIALTQGEGQNWYFGNEAGVSFGTNPPTAMLDGQINQWEGVSSISDPQGNLLFYTNGMTVWNANHNIMQNGSGLLGDWSSTQSAVVVPYPYFPDLYYLFTVDELGGAVRYSLIDMSLNGGLGGVTTTKNVLLFSNAAEKITAVRHDNNSDIWVITHEWGTNNFRSYLVDACNGLNTTPVISSTGTVHNHQSGGVNTGSIGYLKASPQGNKVGLAIYTQAGVSATHFELFDFNSATGVLSNPLSLPSPNPTLPPGESFMRPYGVEFSPDGTFFYGGLNTTGQIYQYDLLAGNNAAIQASATLIGTGTGPNINQIGGLQLAIDGNIYVARDAETYLGRVNNPNTFGASYTNNAVSLLGRNSRLGLPTFIQSFFLDLPDIWIGYSGDDCEGEDIFFSLNGADLPLVTSVDWSFSNGATFNNMPGSATVNTSFSTPGTQTVTATYYFDCYYVVLSGVFEVFPSPSVSISNAPNTYCSDDPIVTLSGSPNGGTWSGPGVISNGFNPASAGPGTHTINYSYTNSSGCAGNDEVQFTVNSIPTLANAPSTINADCGLSNGSLTGASINGNGGFIYSWTNNSGTVVGNSLDLVNVSAGLYTLNVTDANGCTNSFGPFSIANPGAPATPAINISANEGCLNDEITLSIVNPDANIVYDWSGPNSFNSTSNSFTVNLNTSNSGTYCVVATESNCTSGSSCETISLNPSPQLSLSSNSDNDSYCSNEDITITANGAQSYAWSGPNNFSSTQNNFTIQNPNENNSGWYVVEGENEFGCVAQDSINIEVFTLPDANANADQDASTTYCEGGNGLLFGSGGDTYSWEGPNNFNSSDQNPVITNFGFTYEGMYFLTVTDANGCSAIDSVELSVSAFEDVFIIAPDTALCTGETLNLSAGGGTEFVWSGPNGFSSNDQEITIINFGPENSGFYVVTGTNEYGCSDTDSAEVLLLNGPDCFFIPTLVSPNGDNLNDAWVITGIENFPNAEVTIFNRWGNMVFTAAPYNNDWAGKVNKGVNIGDGSGTLPTGTYFYVIELNDGESKPFKGYLELQY